MILNIPYEIYNTLDDKVFFNALMDYQGDCCSDQPTCKTKRIDIAGGEYYIKQHGGVGYLEVLKNLFQFHSPILSAKNEWLALEKCQQLGIATVPLVGYGEKGINPAKKQSFVMTRALKNMPNMQQVILQWDKCPPQLSYKRQIIKQLAQMIRSLHQAGMYHQELYLQHFLLDQNNVQEPQIYLMNLSRVIIKDKISDKNRINDLSALLYSSFNGIFSAKDYFYFLKIYTGKPLKDCVRSPMMRQVFNLAQKLYSKNLGHPPILPAGFMIHFNLADRLNHKTFASAKNFNLQLADGSNVQMGSVLRLVPNKRWIVQAVWQGKPVVVKIFTHESRYHKELKGLERCQKAGVLTPQLLYQGKLPQEKLYVLIFEYLPKDVDHELDLLENLIKTVALHHDKGIMQTDLHVGNFIKNKSQIVTLDGAGIVALKDPLTNFALLLAQFWTLNYDQVKSHVKTYSQLRNITISPGELDEFIKKVDHFKEKRKEAKAKRIFRDSSNITFWDGLNYKILMRNDAYSPQLCYFLHHIEEANSDSAYVVERYTSWNVFSPSPASLRWRETHLAEFTHQTDIIPVAVVEKTGFFNKTSYFIGRHPE